MNELTIGIVGIAALLGLITAGVPIAFALGIVGLVGHIIVTDLNQTMVQLGLLSWEHGTNFLLIAVPLFIFMGQLVARSGIASDLYDCTYKWLGRLPGGLAVTATATSAGFGAVTGSSIASVATMGKMIMPELIKYRYDMRLSTGSIAAAGCLAILIPPSIPMVIYGVWTETSIGALFIAGIIPGILTALIFVAYIVVRCVLNHELGPKGPHFPWNEKFSSLAKLLPTIVIFAVVLGGIYGGVFTPTEASAIGAVGVAIVALIMGRLNWPILRQTLHETGIVSAMLFAIILGGVMFARFLVHTDVTSSLVEVIAGSSLNPYIVLFFIALMYLVLGCVLDTMGMLILTLPFVMPVVLHLGFDPVWFGVFITMMIELALITPPVGLNVYVLKRVVPQVPASEIFWGAAPFVLLISFSVLLLVVWPGMALWLPSLMR
jgi:tripartite ATP-independent transporter DctM subunit